MRRVLFGLAVCVLTLAIPGAAQAQRGGGGHSGGGGGHASSGGAHPSGGAPGSYGHSGSYGHGSYGHNYGYSPYYRGYPGFGYGYGYGVDIYASGYLAGPSVYAVPAYPAQSYYYSAPELRPPPPPPTPAANTASIQVLLPNGGAKLLVDGNPTTSTGEMRTLETPELKSGGNYQYDLTVTWEEGTRTISEKRRINVTPGAATVVDFTRPAPRP